MSRPVRIHIPSAVYLIQIRSRPGVPLFSSEEDRIVFINSMSDAAVPAGVKVYAFALLEQSALLFLRAGQLPLSRFVHRMQAGYFNRIRVLHGGSKPLIHDRHREILVEEDPLFLPVLQRVHLAPVIGGHWSNESEARRWGEISTNRWTSLPVIDGTIETPPGFEREETIAKFAQYDPENPLEVFYRYLVRGTKNTGEDILDHVVAMSLLGRDEFVKRYFEMAKGRKKQPFQAPQPDSSVQRVGSAKDRFNTIVKAVAKEFKSKPSDLVRARSRHPGRKYIVELALRYALDEGGVKQLATHLGISGSAVAHLRRSFSRQLAADPMVQERFKRFEEEVPGK